jgi:signal transduction histidine kinase
MAMCGEIVVETANVEIATGRHVMLAVRDSASGPGSGLGLELVHGMVKHCRGTVRIENEPNSGTCFKIFFPRETA